MAARAFRQSMSNNSYCSLYEPIQHFVNIDMVRRGGVGQGGGVGGRGWLGLKRVGR